MYTQIPAYLLYNIHEVKITTLFLHSEFMVAAL